MENFYRGDTKRITLTITINVTPTDLTGSTILFSMKKKREDSVFALQKQGVFTRPELGEAVITLTPTDTENLSGSYFYDIELTLPNGEVITLICEQVTVMLDVG